MYPDGKGKSGFNDFSETPLGSLDFDFFTYRLSSLVTKTVFL